MNESYVKYFLGYTPPDNRYDTPNVLPNESFEIISKIVRPNSKVLEVGCASGDLLLYLRDTKNCTCTGIEPNSNRALRAIEKDLNIFVGFLDKYSSSFYLSYDYLIYADVLEHLENPVSVLLDGLPFLRPGGLIIISVPNMAHWSIRLNILKGNINYAENGLLDATHLRWFTLQSLKNLLINANFEILSSRVTAGKILPCYSHILRSGFLPQNIKYKLIDTLAKLFPRLFGCQAIILARPLNLSTFS